MKQNWYAKTIEEVYTALETREQGLTIAEVENRLERYGPNSLPEKKADSLFLIFLRQFASPLIYILLAVSVVLFFTQEKNDAWIVLFILIFNAIVGTVQEGRAQATLSALRRFVKTQATVIRDGREIEIPDTEVVPGDVLYLREGEKVSSDSRIIASAGLTVNEASLTGESQPVVKNPDTLTKIPNESLVTGDQINMAFKGTHVVAGSGRAVVVSTGIATVIGRISEEIAKDDSEMPLKANIRQLSKIIIYIVFGMCFVLVVIGLISGQTLSVMLATVITLSVSVIPEGLPIVITLVLANGVWRMSKRNALVKKLQAVEALGQARVIAVDKTGTITKNELVLQRMYSNAKTFSVTGNGYEPKGDIMQGGTVVTPLEVPELILAGRIASLSANAHVMWNETKSDWDISGDPTEAALLVFGEKIGFKKVELLRRHPLAQDIPFDYKKQYHASVHQDDTHNLLTAVGSPEAIFKLSFPHSVPASLKTVVEEFSAEGLRVLGFGFKEVQGFVDPEKLPELTFGGLFAMRDVLHPEARDAVRDIQGAGIKTVMITGDYPVTARAIAEEAGIFAKGDNVITGYELEQMADAELVSKLETTSVFARVTPEHKLRIVRAYHASGKTIAMTGDGVNDAPSLVAADLGIAMGKSGTEVAKEAADIVLLDDNMSTIAAAVEEGRNIYRTIQKVILYLFSTSLGEMFAITGALVVGLPLPVLPVQILWLNFVTDGFLTIALGMEPKQAGLLTEGFEKPNRYLVSKIMLYRMVSMGIVMMLSTLILFDQYLDFAPAKAITVSLTVLAVIQWFNAWNCRSETRSIFTLNPFRNMYLVFATLIVVAFQLLAVYHPFFQKLLHTVPLSGHDWRLIIVIAASVILVEEIRKIVVRLWGKGFRNTSK